MLGAGVGVGKRLTFHVTCQWRYVGDVMVMMLR